MVVVVIIIVNIKIHIQNMSGDTAVTILPLALHAVRWQTPRPLRRMSLK